MLLGALLVLLVLGSAGPASAHAALKSTDPEDGTVLKSAPQRITLTFTESVGLLDDSFRVLDPDNRRVRIGGAGHAQGRSDTASVTLPAKLEQGTYVVAWRVVSADSHPVGGAFTFSVGKPSATTASVDTGPVENPATQSLYNIGRYLAYLAVALVIGTAAFALLCRPTDARPLRKPLVVGWWILLGTTVVLLVLRAPYENGTGPATAFDPAAFTRTLTGRPGLALLARLTLLLLAAVAYVLLRKHPARARLLPTAGAEEAGRSASQERPGGQEAGESGTRSEGAEPEDRSQASTEPPGAQGPPAPRQALQEPDSPVPGALRGAPRLPLVAATAFAVALALTWAAAEHASAGIQVPVAMVSTVLHLLAMAVWLGGLAALLIQLHRTEVPAFVVARFSRLAFVCVSVLVATGVYQSWRGLGSWSALTGTTYGRLLLVKLAAVALLLAAAQVSRRWTARLVAAGAETVVRERVPQPVGGPSLPAAPDAPASAADGSVPRRALRRSVLAEVAVGVVVLVITTVLGGTLPGRAAAEAEAAPATAGGLPAASVTMVPFDVGTPGAHGKVQITLDPGRVGDNSVQAVVFGPDDGIVSIPELRLSFTLPAQKVGPLDAKLTDQGGYWGTNSVTLPIAGTWTMNVTVRTSDIDQVTVSKTVRIQ
ncbi:copper resistance CopC/CopD family protein [Streptomyces gilvus]|uniref:copper resistance CopC/CopD family protein n=1 Tax=Streptomyces gilvus TaxID=2920937 RepID=UPI001F0E0646|nr:copper resistance protein CopC [Streptomyces sp. CME 23]MCH5677689.1 copper resistance protein CopC [Streptomyces sp. CME 23]